MPTSAHRISFPIRRRDGVCSPPVHLAWKRKWPLHRFAVNSAFCFYGPGRSPPSSEPEMVASASPVHATSSGQRRVSTLHWFAVAAECVAATLPFTWPRRFPSPNHCRPSGNKTGPRLKVSLHLHRTPRAHRRSESHAKHTHLTPRPESRPFPSCRLPHAYPVL